MIIVKEKEKKMPVKKKKVDETIRKTNELSVKGSDKKKKNW